MSESQSKCRQVFRAIIRKAVTNKGLIVGGGSKVWNVNVGGRFGIEPMWEVMLNPQNEAYRMAGSVIPPLHACVRHRGIVVGIVGHEGGAFVPFKLGTADNFMEELRHD